MPIRFVNTTTNLPVDEEMEDVFLKTMRPAFKEAVGSSVFHFRLKSFDVFFVDDKDIDLERKSKRDRERELDIDDSFEEGGMDLLGVYFPFHEGFHRPIIKVSPEKVLAFCVSFKANSSIALPLAQLYPLFLVGVVIHELAHLIMDGSSNFHGYKPPWECIVERLEIHPDYDFLHNYDSHYDRHSADGLSIATRRMRRFVEESLANSFVLKQNLNGKHLAALKLAMASEPQGYRQGLLWSGSLGAMLGTAAAWRRFKSELEHHRWQFVFLEEHTPLTKIVERLRSGQSIGSVDMEREFYRHLASRVIDWQSAYEKDKPAWNGPGNETFGVYWRLVNSMSRYGIGPRDRLRFLRQWASNGSVEAVDELNKTLSDNAKARQKYKQALKYQSVRLENVPRLRNNEYWEGKLIAEINASIADIKSLI